MPKKLPRKKYKMYIDEEDIDTGVYAISLVESPAIEENWVYLSKHYQVKLQEANGDKRLLIGPVLIPNREIPRFDSETGEEYDIVFDEAVIEKAAQLFLQRQYNNKSTLEHEKPLEDISIVESWIVADPNADKSNAYGMSYPKGSWIVMAKVNNDEIWNDYVKTGKVKGFSLEGLFGHNLVHASKEVDLSKIQDDADVEFAEEMLTSIKGVIQRDGRYRGGQYVDLQSYSDYPDAVKNNAKRGIELNEKVNNRCATQVGKVRAQQLAQGNPISIQTIKRMYSYLSRAGAFYNPDDTTACGTISYLLWGGDAARRWSHAKLKELGLVEAETSVSVSSSYTGQFGSGRVGRHGVKPRYKNIAELQAQYVAWKTDRKNKKRFPGNTGVMHSPIPTEMQEEKEINVLGYHTRFFHLCPGASGTFTHLVEMPNVDPETEGMIRSAAIVADEVFRLEDEVIKAGSATLHQVVQAGLLVDDFYDIMHEIDEEVGMQHDVSYMQGHIDVINSYFTE